MSKLQSNTISVSLGLKKLWDKIRTDEADGSTLPPPPAAFAMGQIGQGSNWANGQNDMQLYRGANAQQSIVPIAQQDIALNGRQINALNNEQGILVINERTVAKQRDEVRHDMTRQ